MADIDYGDVLAMTQNGNMMNNPLAWLVFLEVFQNGNWGNRNSDSATAADVADSQWKQEINGQMRGLVTGFADSGYANAQLINGVKEAMNSGLNDVTSALNLGFMGQTQQINDLGAKLQSCCCELKTQMMQDRYDALQNENARLFATNSNYQQTQEILNALGRYVTNPPQAPAGLLTSGTTF